MLGVSGSEVSEFSEFSECGRVAARDVLLGAGFGCGVGAEDAKWFR